jgi:hypothetical protein
MDPALDYGPLGREKPVDVLSSNSVGTKPEGRGRPGSDACDLPPTVELISGFQFRCPYDSALVLIPL